MKGTGPGGGAASSGPGLEAGTAVPVAVVLLVVWHVGLVVAAGWASSSRS